MIKVMTISVRITFKNLARLRSDLSRWPALPDTHLSRHHLMPETYGEMGKFMEALE
jgi:hypothetical protein